MTTTLGTRTKTFAYTLAGFTAFACSLALVIWTITPAERNGDIAPQSPFSGSAFWMILAGAAALTLLVILPVSTFLVPKLTHRWNRTTDTSNSH